VPRTKRASVKICSTVAGGFAGSSQKRMYSGSESAGFEQAPGDVVGEVAEAEGCAA